MQPCCSESVYPNMKRIKIIIAIVLFGLTNMANAQNNDEYEALFSPLSIRGNIGLHTGAMSLTSGNLILKTGGSAAVIFNHKLAVGFTGSGFAGSQTTPYNGERYSLAGGYGGFLIEPIIMPHESIHVTFPIAIGGGELHFIEDRWPYYDWDYYRTDQFDDFLYIEPGVSVEVNMTKFMRFSLSGSYLITNSLTSSPLTAEEIEGLNIQATLKLGWFK